MDADAAEAKRLRKAAIRAALEASAAEEHEQSLEDDAKRLRKATKRNAAALEPSTADAPAQSVEDDAERKRLRKAAKRAALEASAAGVEADAVDEVEAKRLRKEAKREALENSGAADGNAADEAEAKRLRKAAKRAALEASTTGKTVDGGGVEGQKIRDVPLTAEEIAERSEKRKERKKQEREAKKTRADSMTVFVEGVFCEESSIRGHFSGCGEIDSIKVLLDKEGKPRGLAYISYKTEAGAAAAVKLDKTSFLNKVLAVQLSKPKLKDNSGFEVFVKHFPRDQPDSALQTMFAPCGPIDKLKIPRFDDGAAKGMAFITFKDSKSVFKALRLDGKHLGGKRIEVKKSGKDTGAKFDKQGKGKSKGAKGGKTGKGKSKDEAKGTGRGRGSANGTE